MHFKTLFSCLFLLFVTTIHAGNYTSNFGSRSHALANTNTTLIDVWSVNNNQAAMGFINELSAGIYYENRFLLNNTSLKAGAFAIPLKNGSIGASVSSYGYSLYSENQAGIAYGQRFGDKLAAGVKLNYINISLGENYGQRSLITGSIGLLAKVNDELTIGAHVFNPNQTKLADYNNERLPAVFKLGLKYDFSEKVFVTLETEKDINFSPVLKAGVEYQPVDKFYIRGGVATNPTLSAFGFGLILKNFRLDVSSSFHQTLGMTPTFSLIYKKAKSK